MDESLFKPIKIVYSEKYESYQVVEGVVDLGYMGVYNTDSIEIDYSIYFLSDIFEADENNSFDIEMYFPLKLYIHEDMTNDEIANGLTEFYNARLADIKKHQTALNQVFLAYILNDLCACGFPFWKECKDHIIEDKMPKCDENNLYDVIYNSEALTAIEKLYEELKESENNKEVDNSTPAEDIFREYFPMFDLDKFLADIYGEYLYFDYANISFQCSGKGQGIEIACGAYANITINNSFFDWHNH